MGLLMAAVQKVRDSGPRTENYTRMAMIGDAIGVAKSKNNMPYVWSGPFNLKVAYQQSDPGARHPPPDVPATWTGVVRLRE